MERLEGILDAWASDPSIDPARTDALRCALSLQHMVNFALRDAGSSTHAAASEWLARWPNASLRLRGDALNALAWGCKSVGELDAGFAAAREAHES